MAIRPLQQRDALENLMAHDFAYLSVVMSVAGTTNQRFIGYCRPGTALSDAGWFITQQEYDEESNVIRITHPVNVKGEVDFDQVWQTTTNYVEISSITNASPAVITTSAAHGWTTGQLIEVLEADVAVVNGDGYGLTMFEVEVTAPTTANLIHPVTGEYINGSGWASAVSTGKVYLREYANYTYV